MELIYSELIDIHQKLLYLCKTNKKESAIRFATMIVLQKNLRKKIKKLPKKQQKKALDLVNVIERVAFYDAPNI